MSRSHTRTHAPLGLAGALAPLGLAVALAVGIAAPAAAHNSIVSSTPEEGEALTALPEQWQITTNENLLDLGGEGAGFALLVSDDQGQFYGDGCVVVQEASILMPAALGVDGSYTLTYQLISADGHTLSGELPFSWQAPADFEPHVGLAEPPICGETASAPAPEPTESTQPEPSPEATVDAAPEPVEPVSDEVSPIIPVVIFMVVLAIAGVVTATILRARSRNAGEQTMGPEGTNP